MHHIKHLSVFLFLLMATLGLRAQSGNVTISEVKAYDMGNGTAVLTVRVSGNIAYQYSGGTFLISGDRIPGGTAGGGIGSESRVIIPSPAPGNGNGNSNGNQAVILTGIFSLSPSNGNGHDSFDVDIMLNHVNPSDRYFSLAKSVNLWEAP